MIQVMNVRNSDRKSSPLPREPRKSCRKKVRIEVDSEIELNVNGSEGTFKAIEYTFTKSNGQDSRGPIENTFL